MNLLEQDNDHKLVAPSPVIPFNDPTLHFVNAGMNQFKAVLQARKHNSECRYEDGNREFLWEG